MIIVNSKIDRRIDAMLAQRVDVAHAILLAEEDLLFEIRGDWLDALERYLQSGSPDPDYAAEIRKAITRLRRQTHWVRDDEIKQAARRAQTRERVRRYRARQRAKRR
jgi:hypothetical protein